MKTILQERILRSKSKEKIDYPSITSLKIDDPLITLENTDKIFIEPYWELPSNWEGDRYIEYIKDNPDYNKVYLRETVAKQLETATTFLPNNLQFVIRAGHRPIEVQTKILNDCMENYIMDNPSASKEEALKHARTYVSDPSISLPPHVCGAAIDLELRNLNTNELLDFGSPINEDDEISYLHYQNLEQEQIDNRMMLLEIMLSADFASLYSEWWHFSYGDQNWAWFYKKENSLFDLAQI